MKEETNLQLAEAEKVIIEMLEDYYNKEIQHFYEDLERNFQVFEFLEKIKYAKTRAIGKFLYSIGLSVLSAKLQTYKFYETRMDLNLKAYESIKEALEYFKETNELRILEHIYDHLIFLLWEKIPYELIIIDERLKLLQDLIEFCKKQEEISAQLGDEAFLTKEERIPYRYTVGEFRYLLEKASLSKEEAIDSNEQLKAKINELENFNFPKAKFWASKWKRRNVCDIEGNKTISFFGGTLTVDGENIEFSNNSFNRSIKIKMHIDPSPALLEQRAYPDIKALRSRVFFTSLSPKIEQVYDDGLQLEFSIERPYKSKGDAFERDNFTITPKRSDDIDYVITIETTGNVFAQEGTTLITENDITLRINDPSLEVIPKEGSTAIKFNLFKKITDAKGPKSDIPEKEELDYLGYGRSIKFTFYCNINPTFSGTFIFSDATNWKYCLGASLFMNKLKFKQAWYPNFLNFDYSPILFLEDGEIPQKFFNKAATGDYLGFLKDIGKEFPGLLEHIVIIGDFMADQPLDKRKSTLMDLLFLMASISHLALDESSVIQIITSNKEYYQEMSQIEVELNKVNEKLTRIYKSKTASAIKIEFIQDSEFISNFIYKNQRIYDLDYEEVYLVENPVLAFVLIPLVKYTKTAILLKDELNSERSQKILTKAREIWAIGDFSGTKIPKKANCKLNMIQNDDIQKDIGNINEIFRRKISEDYKKYAESDFLKRIYPGYNENEMLYNTILTSVDSNDYSFLTLACNYAANKPAYVNVIIDDTEFSNNETEIMKMLGNLRFTETKMINKEDIQAIGEKIQQTIHPLIQKEIGQSQNIIIVSKIPIPFELCNYESYPVCVSKAMGRVCSTDITDTSIMLTLNLMRQMILKTGEQILVIAPKYEGDLALPEAINEASTLAVELKRNFEGKVLKMIDEVIDKPLFFKLLQESLRIIHFSGHGHFVENKSCLILSAPLNKDPIFLFPDDLEEFVESKGVIKGYPLVFTSACITGQIQKSGSGLEGLASQFIKSGASCFIGTLWEILDDSAREFATYLYSGVNKLDKTVGTLILESRKLLHKKSIESLNKEDFFDPTCFAFIFFGDPTIKIK